MKNCTHCKHADWKRTAAGSLHPSGDGRCTWEMPALPPSMHLVGGVFGGYINRKKNLQDHCIYYARKG